MEMFTGGLAAILILLGQGFILQKTGEEFWKGLIPVYGTYLLFKKVWSVKYFAVLLGLAITSGVLAETAGFSFICMGMKTITIALMVGVALLGVAITVEGIMLMYKLAKAFGHGTGYTVGLVFFEPIFVLLLGLNKDRYQVAA